LKTKKERHVVSQGALKLSNAAFNALNASLETTFFEVALAACDQIDYHH
jgi:hypothetical protein